jgi:hypothetical protein
MSFNELIRNESLAGMKRLLRTVKKQETLQNNVPMTFYGVTSNPPSTAEINALIDTPANVGTDFVGLIVDSLNSRQWLVWTDASNWYSFAAGGGQGIVWLDTPVSSTQAGMASGNVDFMLATFGIPDNVRFAVGIGRIVYLGGGGDFGESITLSVATGTNIVSFSTIDLYGTGYASTPVSFFPITSNDRVRLIYGKSSSGVGNADVSFVAYGYVP